MKMKYILLFVIVLFIGVSSCNDDIPFQDESEFAKSTKSLAVTDSLVMPIILDDIEDSVINIETNNDLYSSLIKSMKVVEAKLEVEKWSGNIPQTRASVEILKDYSTSPVPADNKIFTAKFGSDIINAINDYRNPGTVKLSTKKKYQCRWLSAFTFYNLKENQVGGSQNSPNCGLIPESKEGLVKRGYNCLTKLLQKSEMRKNMVMDLIYRGFIYAANYSESHFNPRRSQIKTELRYLFVTTLNR